MMFQIRRAASAALLLDRIAQIIAYRRAEDPLAPIDLVVPSPAAEARLLLALTERLGIASGLRVHLIENWFATRLPASHRARRLTADDLRLELVSLLDDREALATEALAPLARTLDVAPSEAARRRRRDTFAARLAPLFEEYALTRPDLIDTWRQGRCSPSPSDLERWQAATFQELCRRRASRGETADRFLVELLDEALPLEPDDLSVFFAPGFLAARYGDALARLGGEGHIEILQLEFDVFLDKDLAEIDTWARPSAFFRESLENATQQESLHDEIDIAPTTQLQRLQAGLSAEDKTGDASLRLIDAPGAEREAELVADAIARALAESASDRRPLRPWEVLVLTTGPDADLQLTRIASALAARDGIPAVEVDAPAGRVSSYPRAIEQLLDLIASRFDRERCCALFRNPSFRAATPDADHELWEELLVPLDLRHGRDAADHEGSYLPQDLYHWDQALRRLALGALSAPRSPDEGPLALGSHRLFPLTRDIDLAERGRLAAVMRQLIEASRALAEGPPRPAKAWMRAFLELAEASLSVAPDEPEGLALRTAAALRAAGSGATAGAIPLDFDAAVDRAREALRSVRIRPGAQALRGVALAALGSLRPPLARLVIVTGLDENAFPASSRRDGLDLRRERPQEDEYDPRRLDLQRFAEALIGAEDRLVLSYRGRDPRDGDPREPSSVVRTIANWAGEALSVLRGGLDPARGALDDQGEIQAGVNGHQHPTSHHALFARESRAEASVRAFRDAHPEIDPSHVEDAGFLLRIPALPRVSPWPEGGGLLVRDARLIVDFLSCPLQASLRAAGGLRDADEDLSAESDEPFSVQPREQVTLLRRVVDSLATRGDFSNPAALLAEHLRDIEYCEPGWSAGVFHEQDRRELKRRVDGLTQVLQSRDLGATTFVRPRLLAALGPNDERDAEFETRTLEVTLPTSATGNSQAPPRVLRVTAQGDLVALSAESYTWLRVYRSKPAGIELARAYVQAAWLAAAGLTENRAGRALFVYNDDKAKGACGSIDLPPLDRERARAWLAARFADVLGEIHTELLPIDVLLAIIPPEYRAQPSRTQATSLMTALENVRRKGGLRTQRGPLRAWRDFDPPSPERARELLRERYGMFLGNTLEEALQ